MNHIRIDITKNTAATNIPQHLIHNPFFIPKDQEYYWTPEWQKGERESQADLEAGNYRDFDNAEDAIRWLDEPEE